MTSTNAATPTSDALGESVRGMIVSAIEPTSERLALVSPFVGLRPEATRAHAATASWGRKASAVAAPKDFRRSRRSIGDQRKRDEQRVRFGATAVNRKS